MLELKIDIRSTCCEILSCDFLTSGCVNAVACLFSFDESWNDFEKVASFESAYGIYHQKIENGQCLIPNAIVARASYVNIGVIGTKGDKTLTTNLENFRISEGANKDGSTDADYEPTLLEQILKEVEYIRNLVQSVRTDADAGVFDGEDGVSIESVEQTTTSTADGGINIVTVRLTDGTVTTFEIRNGPKGSAGPQGPKGDTGAAGPQGVQGPAGTNGKDGKDGVNGTNGKDGADGYTPVRGIDYWTDADIAEIKSYVDGAILGGAW